MWQGYTLGQPPQVLCSLNQTLLHTVDGLTGVSQVLEVLLLECSHLLLYQCLTLDCQGRVLTVKPLRTQCACLACAPFLQQLLDSMPCARPHVCIFGRSGFTDCGLDDIPMQWFCAGEFWGFVHVRERVWSWF